MNTLLNTFVLTYFFLWIIGFPYGLYVGILAEQFNDSEYSNKTRKIALFIFIIINLPWIILSLWSFLFYGHRC
jgi:ABC-type phosphate transport system permease subunit